MDNDKSVQILQLIISAASETTDSLEFGQTVATILESEKLIDSAVHNILTGKL